MIKTFFLFLIITVFAQSPEMESHYSNKTWDTMMKDVKMRYRFSVEHNNFIQVPRFGKDVQDLNGKEIVLRGFFLPADVTGNTYVLSYVPMQMCFFCTGSGIESVVELQSAVSHRVRFRRLNTDDFIEVKGKLKLNVSNMDHLIYILEDATLVNVVKQ
jgi:hypothetical protein